MGYDYSKAQERPKWHKISFQHESENIGKKFLIKDVRWEPGNKYIGKIGKCVDTCIAHNNSDVRYIELSVAPGVMYELKDLKEI